jgi:hypothetical protein
MLLISRAIPVNYMKINEWMLDRRVIRQNLRRGAVARADYQKYLSSLPDMSQNVAHDDPAELTSRSTPRAQEAEDAPEAGGDE